MGGSLKVSDATPPSLNAQITTLANAPSTRECLQWFSREKQWITEQHLSLCRIPAPTFLEEKRAEWMVAQFRAIGCSARIDRGGNVIAQLSANRPDRSWPSPLISTLCWRRVSRRMFRSIPTGACAGPGFPTMEPGCRRCWPSPGPSSRCRRPAKAPKTFFHRQRRRGRRGQPERHPVSLPAIFARSPHPRLRRSRWPHHRAHHLQSARQPPVRGRVFRLRRT